MAEEIIITELDRINAENFLEQFLGDKITDGDFKKGGALRDLAISAIAYVFAYLQKERDIIKARQSLLQLAALVSTTDVDDAVDEILSNWYLSRKTGRNSRGTVTIWFSQECDVVIPVTTRFFKTASVIFVPDSTDSLLYSKDDMTAVTDEEGATIAYTISGVPLVAESEGDNDIDAGPFIDWTVFNTNVTAIENTSEFTGGGTIETTEEMLERAETAIAERSLNSPRSIDAVLKEEFTQVDDVVVIGFGDDEMIRDLVLEAATNSRIHAGGHTDAYLTSPILESKQFEGEVGGEFTDPRPGHYILRDDTVADFTTVGGGVIAGDILRIYNNLAISEATLYIVDAVTKYGVYVSRRAMFPMALPTVEQDLEDGSVGAAGDTLTSVSYTFVAADVGKWVRIKNSTLGNDGTWVISAVVAGVATLRTWDLLVPSFTAESDLDWELDTRVVEYSIGSTSPDFDLKVSRRITGRFTKTIQQNGRILLPDWPIYRITDVSFSGGGAPLEVDGRTTFLARVNETPADPSGDPDDLEFQVIGNNPGEVPSGWQVMELIVGHAGDATAFDGETLRVTYDTLTGFDSVWAFMVSLTRRISCGSVIPKGVHPV